MEYYVIRMPDLSPVGPTVSLPIWVPRSGTGQGHSKSFAREVFKKKPYLDLALVWKKLPARPRLRIPNQGWNPTWARYSYPGYDLAVIGTGKTRPGPDRAMCLISGLGHVLWLLYGHMFVLRYRSKIRLECYARSGPSQKIFDGTLKSVLVWLGCPNRTMWPGPGLEEITELGLSPNRF